MAPTALRIRSRCLVLPARSRGGHESQSLPSAILRLAQQMWPSKEALVVGGGTVSTGDATGVRGSPATCLARRPLVVAEGAGREWGCCSSRSGTPSVAQKGFSLAS